VNHQWRGSHGALAGPIVLATTRIRSLASGERATTPMDAGVGGELGQLAGASEPQAFEPVAKHQIAALGHN
jgi:hypothetical protein